MNYKNDFPIFENHPNLVYLDSAATSQRPKVVIDSIKDFYEKHNANIHRGAYTLSEEATLRYNQARKKVAEFINAKENEIVFTKNATESFNLLSNTLQEIIPSQGKDEIVLTEMEHHSNLVPWQQFAKKNNFKLRFIPITENYELDYAEAEKLITEKTAIVSFTWVSNVFGTVNNIEKIISLAKKNNSLTIIDAAQAVQHLKTDVKKLDCDFLAFSSHKIFGLTGVGVLYGKEDLLNKIPPFQFGGGMITSVSYEESSFLEAPEKFEAGTQNISEVIAFGKAIEYLEEKGIENIGKYEKEIFEYALDELKKLEKIKIYNPGKEKSISLISFNIEGVHHHDVASILDEKDIAIRAGHHCCMPLMKKLGISGTCRASFSIYNSKEDVDKLILAIKKVLELFK